MEITRRKFIKSAAVVTTFSTIASKLPRLSLFGVNRKNGQAHTYKDLKKARFYKKL